MSRIALLVLLGACGPYVRYTAFDATKAQSIAIQPTVTIEGAIAFCGPTVALPPVAVTMVDGRQRATANVAQDALLDGAELVWSSSLGQVRHDAGSNRDVFDATADYWRLLDEDVTLTVALAKNRAITASITLLPTFVCQQVANFGGAPGAGGYSGESGNPGSPQRHGGGGRDGELGGPGGHGPDVVVDLTVAGTKKRGKLVFARVGRQAFVFAEKGGGLVVIAAGGQGGTGGRGGRGGSGGNGGTRDNTCLTPGDGGPGGRGGDGGDGGDGGSVLVRVDRAYPQLADLVQVSVEGGRGGDVGAPGDGGRGGEPEGSVTDGSGSSTSCSSKVSRGQDGQYGQPGQRPGRDGRPGRSAVKLESLTTLFPEGVNLIDRAGGAGASTTRP